MIGSTSYLVVAIYIRRIGTTCVHVARFDTIAGKTIVADVVVGHVHASAHLGITRINRANDVVIAVQRRAVDAESAIARFRAVAGIAVVTL